MNMKVHEISQVACVLIAYRCQSIRRKPVLPRRKWGKWVLCLFMLGKLRFGDIQGQILPPCTYTVGFRTQGRPANSIPCAIVVKRKFTGDQKPLQALLKGKAIFSRVTLQELIFFSSVTLPELPRTRDFCTQPVCCRGAPTHCHRATADCPCPLACSPLQSQQNYLDK